MLRKRELSGQELAAEELAVPAAAAEAEEATEEQEEGVVELPFRREVLLMMLIRAEVQEAEAVHRTSFHRLTRRRSTATTSP